jgi:hypothetical protein
MYTLQALIASRDVLASLADQDCFIVALQNDIAMIPLSSAARARFGMPFLPLTDDGSEQLPEPAADLLAHASCRGRLAYIEAEYFGGSGTQAHVLYESGAQIQIVVNGIAINEALRFLGVRADAKVDEFATVGLGRHRNTEGWTNS